MLILSYRRQKNTDGIVTQNAIPGFNLQAGSDFQLYFSYTDDNTMESTSGGIQTIQSDSPTGTIQAGNQVFFTFQGEFIKSTRSIAGPSTVNYTIIAEDPPSFGTFSSGDILGQLNELDVFWNSEVPFVDLRLGQLPINVSDGGILLFWDVGAPARSQFSGKFTSISSIPEPSLSLFLCSSMFAFSHLRRRS